MVELVNVLSIWIRTQMFRITIVVGRFNTGQIWWYIDNHCSLLVGFPNANSPPKKNSDLWWFQKMLKGTEFMYQSISNKFRMKGMVYMQCHCSRYHAASKVNKFLVLLDVTYSTIINIFFTPTYFVFYHSWWRWYVRFDVGIQIWMASYMSTVSVKYPFFLSLRN